MAHLQKRNLGQPDELRLVGRGQLELVEMGDAAFGRVTFEPGWRWSVDVRPIVGTELCDVYHVGYVVSGTLRVEMGDGSILEAGAGDIYEMPPGHDAWVIGDEPWVSVDWTGGRHFGQGLESAANPVLATIIFTDIIGSTQLAAKIGDLAWRDLLVDYHAMLRRAIERYRGREIQKTGDGMLATFDSPARAVRCALDTAARAPELGLQQRAGLHTGEIELAGEDVRGVAVHIAARVAAAADAGEVFVSATTNSLLFGSGLTTVSRGSQSLKGIAQPMELFKVEGGVS